MLNLMVIGVVEMSIFFFIAVLYKHIPYLIFHENYLLLIILRGINGINSRIRELQLLSDFMLEGDRFQILERLASNTFLRCEHEFEH